MNLNCARAGNGTYLRHAGMADILLAPNVRAMWRALAYRVGAQPDADSTGGPGNSDASA
jgi:hypothetical protein